jgi:hypothetical protein
MPSPWYSGKKADVITLTPGVPQAVAEITVDDCAPADWAIISANLKLRLTSPGARKMDVWLLRVKADDSTAWSSPCFPGGTDDFYWWPTWLGAVTKGETYRWYVRTEKGLTGSLSTRYAKGILVPRAFAPPPSGGGLDLKIDKFSIKNPEEVW